MEVEIKINGTPVKVRIKKLKVKDWSKIVRESVKEARMLAGEPDVKFDVFAQMIALVKYGVEAPFPLTNEIIDDMEAEDFYKLIDAIKHENFFLSEESLR